MAASASRLLIGLALLGLGFVLAITRHGGARHEAVAVAASVVSAPPSTPSAASTEPPLAERASVPGNELSLLPHTPSTAGEFLAAYYGERWPEIEARIRASGAFDPDTPYVFRPWEEVEPEFRAAIVMQPAFRASIVQNKLRWPEVLTAEYVAAEYAPSGSERALEPSDLEGLARAVEARNTEIAALAEAFAWGVEYHVQECWEHGRIVKGPFTTAGLSDVRGFHSESHAGYGWAVTITLTWDDCPDLLALDGELEALRSARDRTALAYLASEVR